MYTYVYTCVRACHVPYPLEEAGVALVCLVASGVFHVGISNRHRIRCEELLEAFFGSLVRVTEFAFSPGHDRLRHNTTGLLVRKKGGVHLLRLGVRNYNFGHLAFDDRPLLQVGERRVRRAPGRLVRWRVCRPHQHLPLLARGDGGREVLKLHFEETTRELHHARVSVVVLKHIRILEAAIRREGHVTIRREERLCVRLGVGAIEAAATPCVEDRRNNIEWHLMCRGTAHTPHVCPFSPQFAQLSFLFFFQVVISYPPFRSSQRLLSSSSPPLLAATLLPLVPALVSRFSSVLVLYLRLHDMIDIYSGGGGGGGGGDQRERQNNMTMYT